MSDKISGKFHPISVANWYPSLVCYGGHFGSKITAKIQYSSDLGESWFQSTFCWSELISTVWEPYYDPLCRNIHRSMWQLLGVELFVATTAILKFQILKIMCTHVRQNLWKVSSNFEHHSKPTMNINSKHHNLLGTQFNTKVNNNHIFSDLVCK
jgi:hypothetical protein